MDKYTSEELEKLYKLFLQLSVDVKKYSQNLWRVPLSTHSLRT
jgi:hypothetical protein